MRQSDSFAKVGRAKQQPIKNDVNDSCLEDVQLKKQSSLASSSSHTSYVSDDNNIIFEDKRFQSTVENTERKSHGHDVAPVMVTADKIPEQILGKKKVPEQMQVETTQDSSSYVALWEQLLHQHRRFNGVRIRSLWVNSVLSGYELATKTYI
ncbi:hypothetical protein YC2023_085222 [Brassica napus]